MNGGKCEFGVDRVAYLEHVISAAGVSVDEDQISAMVSWPSPKSRGVERIPRAYRLLPEICEGVCTVDKGPD